MVFLNSEKHYPRQLSGGMRQRAVLIRTPAINPDILLLDEAFPTLDFQIRLQVCDDVYSIIKNEGITALLVTRDISLFLQVQGVLSFCQKKLTKKQRAENFSWMMN